MNLSPRQLKIFVSLAESLNFSRTADKFFVAQPTLSKIIREIEQEFGLRLFDRTTRSVKLTADGVELLSVASRVAQEFEVGITELEEVARRHTQRLSIAALPTLAASLLPLPIAALRAEMPNAYIKIYDVFTDHALDLLRARKVDLALTGVDVIHKDLAYTEILSERFVLLTSRAHPTASLPRVWSEALLSNFPVISMPRGTGARQQVEAAFMRKGLQFRPFLEFHNLTTIASFIKTGCGIGLLPLSGAQLVLDDQLEIISLKGAPERSIGIVTRRELELPLLAAKMIRSIREHANAMCTY